MVRGYTIENGHMYRSYTEEINNWFTYHKPKPEDIEKYQEIRDSAKSLAEVIDKNCPGSPDKSAALRKLRECVMTANASIALLDWNYE